MDAKRPINIVFHIFSRKGLYGIPRLGEGAIEMKLVLKKRKEDNFQDFLMKIVYFRVVW